MHQAACSTAAPPAGAGELAASTASIGVPASAPLLLLSLGAALLPCGPCGSFEALESLFTSPANSDSLLVVAHELTPQATPVKLRSWKPARCHLRHGFPVRSKARRCALMAPWLALGPSLGPAAKGAEVPLTISPLEYICQYSFRVFEEVTYGRIFFLGPGFPRGLGTPSIVICDALRFMPGFGPGMPFRFTPLDGGASKLLFDPPFGIGVELESDTLPEGDGSATALD